VRLKDRVAIITGAAQGIGKAYALRFARECAHVVAADIREEQARAFAAECTAIGPEALAVRVDVSDEASTAAAAERTIGRWLERWEESGVGQFVAERREDGRYVGRAGFLVWDPVAWEPAAAGETEIGWTLVRSQCGHGYATEAALALRDWALEERGLERLISLIQHGNLRSVRVAEKIGESYEKDVEVRGQPTRLYSLTA